MSLLTKVTVTFEIESLQPLEKDTVAERIGELLAPSDRENWFESPDNYGIYNENSLSITVDQESN